MALCLSKPLVSSFFFYFYFSFFYVLIKILCLCCCCHFLTAGSGGTFYPTFTAIISGSGTCADITWTHQQNQWQNQPNPPKSSPMHRPLINAEMFIRCMMSPSAQHSNRKQAKLKRKERTRAHRYTHTRSRTHKITRIKREMSGVLKPRRVPTFAVSIWTLWYSLHRHIQFGTAVI